MNNNLELIYWTNNGGVELPLEDWQGGAGMSSRSPWY